MHADQSHSRITVLARMNTLSFFYSLAPLLLVKDIAERLDFTQSVDHCLRRDRNRLLIIVRLFEHIGLHNRPADLKLMAHLREKYDRIAYFDDGDGAGCTRFEVLPFVDVYLKKQLFRDLSIYRRRLYGRQLFSEYYHRQLGVTDPEPNFRQPIDPTEESKLHVAWNLGVGSFPIQPYWQRLGVRLASLGMERLGFRFYRHPLSYRSRNHNSHDVHARFTAPSVRPTIFFQRKMLLEKIGDAPQFLTGRVPQRRYKQEIRHAKITLSPFGWGEVCYRDFEAVLNQSMLMKPRMEHLTTWPDIYRPFETYVPIAWDGQDVMKRVQDFLDNAAARRQIAGNAKDAYYEALGNLPQRAHAVMERIVEPHHRPTAALNSKTSPPAHPESDYPSCEARQTSILFPSR